MTGPPAEGAAGLTWRGDGGGDDVAGERLPRRLDEMDLLTTQLELRMQLKS